VEEYSTGCKQRLTLNLEAASPRDEAGISLTLPEGPGTTLYTLSSSVADVKGRKEGGGDTDTAALETSHKNQGESEAQKNFLVGVIRSVIDIN